MEEEADETIQGSENEDVSIDMEEGIEHEEKDLENHRSDEPRTATMSESGASFTKVNARRSQLSMRFSRRTNDGKILLPDEVQKGADTLEFGSRDVYESTKMKMVLSVILSSFALIVFGFCTSSGGRAEALYLTSRAYGDRDLTLWYNSTSGNYTTVFVKEFIEVAFDGHTYLDLDESYLYRFSQAYGFACFCYLVSSLLALIAAVRISPLCCGAVGEMATILKFQNWEEHHFFFGLKSPTFKELAQQKKDDEYRSLEHENYPQEEITNTSEHSQGTEGDTS